MLRKRFPFKRHGGTLALVALGLALAVANSPLAWLYDLVHHTPIGVHAGSLAIDEPLIVWINEGLMVFFFLLVSLEVKREVLEGHLASLRLSALPAAAALGGMIVPASIFAAFTWSDAVAVHGWAIPTATDIVLALAVLSLAGDRIVQAQRVFLTAFAVLDDVGGILIIAMFYSGGLVGPLLALTAAAAAVLAALHHWRVQRLAIYGATGVILWLALFDSGVNPTLTGVIVGALIPLRSTDGRRSPLRELERWLEPWVAVGVMPLFVFFNAGLRLADASGQALLTPVGLGLILGLSVGKPLGIIGGAWVAVHLRLARLPSSLTWPGLVGVALLGGIGFTVSMFLASLAFGDSDLGRVAKLGILIGSALSAALGLITIRRLGPAGTP